MARSEGDAKATPAQLTYHAVQMQEARHALIRAQAKVDRACRVYRGRMAKEKAASSAMLRLTDEFNGLLDRGSGQPAA